MWTRGEDPKPVEQPNWFVIQAQLAWRDAFEHVRLTSLEADLLNRGYLLWAEGKGLSARSLAAEMSVSVRTVEKHIENIYGKLGASVPRGGIWAAWENHLSKTFWRVRMGINS